MTEESGRNVVFWSGGQDSTLMAIQLLRADKNVDLVTFDNCWIGGEHQQNLEKIHRKRMIDKMVKEFKGQVFTHNYTWDGDLIANVQNRAWVCLFPLACKDGDKAYFGSIKSDEFWHWKETFVKTFNQICEYQKKKVSLEFPLEWIDKKGVKTQLKRYGYLDLAIHSGDRL